MAWSSFGKLVGLTVCAVFIGGYFLTLIKAGSQDPKIDPGYSAPNIHAAVAALPPPPAHHYVAIVRGYFAYPSGLSDNDRARGIASKPLTLVGYQGKRGGEYSFSVSDGGPYVDLLSCVEPCEVAQTTGMSGNHVFQVQPGTLLSAIIEDARNGLLDSATPSIQPTSRINEETTVPDGAQGVIQEIVRQGFGDPSDWSERQLGENFRCPETLTTEDQQKASVAQTVVWYGRHHQNFTADDVMKFRHTLLVSHNCTQTLANLSQSGG